MKPRSRCPYRNLEDFLISHPLSVDAELDDGWGSTYPLKGREIQAAILFADISGFSERTLSLGPTGTLMFVNNFFCWITAEALHEGFGIVDKYIGDELMVVFSDEFGSDDPVFDALRAAKRIAENDALAYCPHIGIAAGVVTVGFVGTPVKYNCSVFGRAVTLASRCASVEPSGLGSSSVMMPADLWAGRDLDAVFPPSKCQHEDESTYTEPRSWRLLPERVVALKNVGNIAVQEIALVTIHIPGFSQEEHVRRTIESLSESGRYTPRGS